MNLSLSCLAISHKKEKLKVQTPHRSADCRHWFSAGYRTPQRALRGKYRHTIGNCSGLTLQYIVSTKKGRGRGRAVFTLDRFRVAPQGHLLQSVQGPWGGGDVASDKKVELK